MRYNRTALIDYCTEALMAAGASRSEAEQTAWVLTSADERGVHSHGVMRMQGYTVCLQSGGISGSAEYRTVSDGASYALIDAGRGLASRFRSVLRSLPSERQRSPASPLSTSATATITAHAAIIPFKWRSRG